MSHRFYLFVPTVIWHADCSKSRVTVLVLFIKCVLDMRMHFCWLATTTDLTLVIWAAHLLFSCGIYIWGELNRSFLTSQITFPKSILYSNPWEPRSVRLSNFRDWVKLRSLRIWCFLFFTQINSYVLCVRHLTVVLIVSLHEKQIQISLDMASPR